MNVLRVYLFLSIVLQSHMPNPPETLRQNDFGGTTVGGDQGDKELHVCLRQTDGAFSLSAGLLEIHHVMFFLYEDVKCYF
ncbi:hypothetical protein IRJ41_007004 [Triplophysa rosa]|uniref:Secreted protein n=1 Tax=Triplophysa rosa TaxID=992332 RepID=A0A9W7TNJ8_TRIRA|nr:hypothetical protein IRJ41_007004 [Triplophysa rosa]